MALNILITLMGIGIAVIIAMGFWLLIKKTKPPTKLKKYLILIGASITGFLVFAILHNIISGLLGQLLKKEVEEPVFFLLATIACPVGLIIGIIGSIIQIINKH